SRFVARIIAPVGSSIDYIDDRLQHCERKLQSRPDVASFLTTVAAEPGQLINEADIFVQLTPRQERTLTQHEIMAQVRSDLEKVADIRVVLRDQSTEGFTAQRGDPVDFAIQGDWDRLPRFSQEIMDEMVRSGKYQDIDSDYRPGMPEVRILPNRDKLALVNMTMAHLANSLSLHVGGQRIAKYTEGGRRYDIRMRLQLPQRASPSQLESILLRAGDNRLVPLGDVANIDIVSTLPIINRYNHQRKVQISASPAPGVSQGEAIAYFDVIVDKAKKTLTEKVWNRPEISGEREAASGSGEYARDFTITELGNAEAMRDTINSLVFALVLGIIIAYMILGVQFNSFVHPLT
ncbi:MAG: efflux RND transporter permease subunit, partial [Phycisphaerales bacterium]|nr:efflux RND transporter permease subunit [Phycisphaerales bacterium]